MKDHFKYTSTILSEVAEGSPERRETQEPSSPLKTTTLPVIKDTGIAPKAETGQLPAVSSQAEGRDDHDSQDADRITEETHPMPDAVQNLTAGHAPSVLIIEDTTELAEVIQATLERMNMRTAVESHGSKAISRFSDFNPDVVLLDIGLPDITGWQFLEGIKEKRSKSDKMPIVIVITAYGDPANRLVGKLQGVHDYLIKPFTADEVEKVVQRALSSTAQ